MPLAAQSTEAFNQLIRLLADVRDDYVLSPERKPDELDAVEGFRYIFHLLSEGTELFLEGDTERPRFSSIVTPARKFLGDNADAIYHQALIRGDRAYRVTGTRDREAYISFTIHGRDPAGGINGPILADLNDRQFDVDPDGNFELILSPDERPGNWIRLDPEARTVLVRSYFLEQTSAHNNPDIRVWLQIEPIDDPGPAPPIDDATLAQRMLDTIAFVRATSIGVRVFGEANPAPVPFVGNVPNSVGTPWSFRNTGIAAAGAVDIFYSSGTFDLGPDDALVMEGTMPDCDFANLVLWNPHMQTLDYRSRRSSLNSAQMELGPGGEYRLVISERDPGVANWLDTGGHRRGTMFWRFLLPKEDPETPRCRVVPVSEVSSS
ncbi:MAG: DUF1214 domain-containing protein [Acidimicrobiia bacterium]